jgi:uncharacterized Ntn-hydrolase superfamily protein
MKLFLLIYLILLITAITNYSQINPSGPLAHTFSIVARDPETGEIGTAVQSHWFNVGSDVTWAEAGVGAVATQSFVNVSFGRRGLDLLKAGKSPEEVLKILIDSDSARDFRQVAIIDAQGRAASYTGKLCIKDAGNIVGDNFSVQANMMLNDRVWPTMAKAFKETKAPLAERMIAALQAGQAAGGDIRGQQSAAVIVVKGKASDKPWEDKLIDLRVEDNPNAVKEIERVLRTYRAYEHMNNGDLAIEKKDEKKALQEYGAAESMFPDNLEMKYWTAVSLVNIGKLNDALPLFKNVFKKDKNWIELTRRIVPNGLLKVDEKTLNKILSAK